MSKNRNAPIATTELLPPEPQGPQSELSQLERLVQQKVAEILASREDLLLRPFFDTRRIAEELRRLQTMPARRKWSVYYATFGCLICRRKRESHHGGCGMCWNCYQRTSTRLRTIVDEATRPRARQRFNGDLESIARKALRGTINALPPAKEGGE
ncbi:MAG: hypothetical protein WA876_11250 [Candidatus Acidiferrales bacterium]